MSQETYEDYSVVVSIDRKKGNPNRDAKVLVYQYETEGEAVVGVSNKIQMVTSLNTDTETGTKRLFTTKEDAYVNYTATGSKEIEVIVYDVRGSKVISVKKQVKTGANKLMLRGINKSGVYFVVIKDGEERETTKINIIK